MEIGLTEDTVYTQDYRIQVIHAIVLSTLWTMYTIAIFQKSITPCFAVPGLIHDALIQHLTSEKA